MKFIYGLFFVLLLLVGTPMVYLLILAPGLDLTVNGNTRQYIALLKRVFNGMDSFVLVALPFFILAGELMSAGGITVRLVNLAKFIVGRSKGGLSHVTVASSAMLAGGCGSAVADASALGSMLIPAMEKNGYRRDYAAGITAAAAVIVPIIPPSGIMIMYAFINDVSVAAMFIGGIIPGLIIALSLMMMTWILARVKNFPTPDESYARDYKKAGQSIFVGLMPLLLAYLAFKYGFGVLLFIFLLAAYGFVVYRFINREYIMPAIQSMAALLTPVILMGGIMGGVFTPTEGAAVAAFWSLIVGLYVNKELKYKDLPKIFLKSAISAGVILMLVASAVAFAYIISRSRAPQELSGIVLGITQNKFLLFALVNVLLLIVGTFLDAGPAILILGPILAPVMISVGIDPTHFAVVMCINLIVGLITPPMGLVLFVLSGMTGIGIGKIAKQMMPYFLVEVAIIFLISYIPALTLWLPHMFNFT